MLTKNRNIQSGNLENTKCKVEPIIKIAKKKENNLPTNRNTYIHLRTPHYHHKTHPTDARYYAGEEETAQNNGYKIDNAKAD